MAIAELGIIPIGTKSTSLSSYVAACLKVLKKSGLTYEMHGMGTVIEGDLKDLFDVVMKMPCAVSSRGTSGCDLHKGQ